MWYNVNTGIGNPLSYYNGYSFTWQYGRELATANNGSNSISYKYNTDGIRVSKVVNGILHEYTLDGTTIVREVIYTGSTNSYAIDEDLRYFYDANGYLSTIDRLQYDGSSSYTRTKYFAKTNLQGDVLALYTYSGSTATQVASYRYDAWGRDVSLNSYGSNDIATLNPFRYRSYYYDAELGMYYLNTRYYDPQIGRFINADDTSIITVSPEAFTDKNLYAYCDNNPVMRSDNGGELWHVLVGALVGGGFELASQLLSGTPLSEVNWTKVGVATVSGGLQAIAGPISGALINGATEIIQARLDGETGEDLLLAGLEGVASSAISSGIGFAAKKIGGKIAVKNLSKTSKANIKSTIASLYPEIKGRDINQLKNIYGSFVKENCRGLGSKLLGKNIPRAIDVGVSVFTGVGDLIYESKEKLHWEFYKTFHIRMACSNWYKCFCLFNLYRYVNIFVLIR